MKRRFAILVAMAGLVAALVALVVSGEMEGVIAWGASNDETTIIVDDASADLSSMVCSADAAPMPVDATPPCPDSLAEPDSKGAGDRMSNCLSCHADIFDN